MIYSEADTLVEALEIGMNKALELGEKPEPLLSHAHVKMMAIHSRALACHCECLALNAENSAAVLDGKKPPYDDTRYYLVMKKWGVIGERNES